MSNSQGRSQNWIVLGVFSLAAAASQALALNFAPLISLVEGKYGVTEDRAGLLLLVFPLFYVLVSVPSGKYIDRRGYRKSLCLGCGIMAAFAALRIFDFGFWILVAAQIGIAIAQPLIINSISKLVLDWFEKDQEAIATGIGTAGMFIGLALGMMATPIFVSATGYQNTMVIFAGLATLSFVLCLLFVRRPVSPAGGSRDAGTPVGALGFREIWRDKNLLLIFILAFLGLGFFNGLTTWIEPILAPYGISSVQAGIIGGMLIVGGIFGAAVIPTISDLVKRRKPLLVMSTVVAALGIYPLCRNGHFSSLLILATLQGFFFLPAFSILLQMCAEHVGEARAGIATGILMLLGNAGGVLVIIAMEAVKTDAGGFTPSVNLMFTLLVTSVLLSTLLSETHPKWRAYK